MVMAWGQGCGMSVLLFCSTLTLPPLPLHTHTQTHTAPSTTPHTYHTHTHCPLYHSLHTYHTHTHTQPSTQHLHSMPRPAPDTLTPTLPSVERKHWPDQVDMEPKMAVYVVSISFHYFICHSTSLCPTVSILFPHWFCTPTGQNAVVLPIAIIHCLTTKLASGM